MAAAMISDRGLRKKMTQEIVKDVTKTSPKKTTKRKAPTPKPKAATENNNNTSKKPKIVPNGDGKEDLFDVYQPWVINAYGDLAKTKTITLRKYARILKTLKGEDVHSSDSSKFRFWVKAKGFYLGKPQGYDAKPADGIVCRYSALDVDGGQERIDLCSGSGNDPALYVPTAPVKNAPVKETVYRKVAIVENFFDIIYTVHVDLEGRGGKHAGQKRTYRTITETYAFLPREAVTRFLMGCTACQRRPRSPTPPLLPTPSPSPTLITAQTNGFHQISPGNIKSDVTHNGIMEKLGKKCENEKEIQVTKITDPIVSFHSDKAPFRPYLPVADHIPIQKDLPPQNNVYLNGSHKSGSAFHPVHNPSTLIQPSFATSDEAIKINKYSSSNNEELNSNSESMDAKYNNNLIIDVDAKSENECENDVDVIKEKPKKPYNPLDVCNLTSKDPPSPFKRRLNSAKESKNEIIHSGDLGKGFSRPWSPAENVTPNVAVKAEPSNGQFMFQDTNIDYTVPITTTYLKHMQKLGYSHNFLVNKDSLNSESSDITEEDHFPGLQLKDADKLKLLLLAWNIQNQKKARNGEVNDVGTVTGGVGSETNMADLWASYHTALGLASGAGSGGIPGVRRSRDQPSPVLLGSNPEGPGNHDETSSSAGNGKEDEDTLASDDESDERLDPQTHDPERLKAFNMFVRLFVDENLDRMVPISKQPKEKIQAIIDSCTRQFPEFAERARKRIRTYLKSCRRNKKVRGEGGGNGNGTPTWDSTIRPTPAHLTSVQAEQILAQACENESHNAKRMRLGLEPVSQPMPTTGTTITMDTTPPTTAHPLLNVYGTPQGSINTTSSANSSGLLSKPSAPSPNTGTSTTSLITAHHNGGCHNNNNKPDIGNKNTSSRTSTPSASGSVTDFTSSLGVTSTPSSLHSFGHASLTGTPSANALLSTLGAVAGLHNAGGNTTSNSATNAAVAAYQNALFSAAMAHQGPGLNFGGLGVALAGSGPTDLSMKNPTLSSGFPSLSTATAASALGLNSAASSISHTGQNNNKPLLLSHKLNTAEMTAVRQLITGYRESAAFLLRSADELETLLLQQP